MELVTLIMSILSPVSTVVVLAMAWQKLRDRSDENRRRIEQLEADSVCYETLATKLTELSTDIGWIKRDIDRKSNGNSGYGGQYGKGGQGNA